MGTDERLNRTRNLVPLRRRLAVTSSIPSGIYRPSRSTRTTAVLRRVTMVRGLLRVAFSPSSPALTKLLECLLRVRRILLAIPFPLRCCGYCSDDFAAPDTAEVLSRLSRIICDAAAFAPVPEAKPQRDSAIDDLNIDFMPLNRTLSRWRSRKKTVWQRLLAVARAARRGPRALSFR